MTPEPGTRVVRWRRYGHDRLYINAADGQQLGWHDLTKGHTHVTEPSPQDRGAAGGLDVAGLN